MSRAQKIKGTAYERAIVNDLRAIGIDAKRVPLSGASEFTEQCDVLVPLLLRDLEAECKVGQQCPKSVYTWLEGNDLLFLRRDREKTLVVLPWATWKALVKALTP